MMEQKREGNGNAEEEEEKGKEGGRAVENVKQGMNELAACEERQQGQGKDASMHMYTQLNIKGTYLHAAHKARQCKARYILCALCVPRGTQQVLCSPTVHLGLEAAKINA